MAFVPFTLESLKELDKGIIGRLFLDAVNRAGMDMMDRPGDAKPRTITLQCALTPVTETEGGILECVGSEAEFQVTDKVPVRRSKKYGLRMNKKGQMSFSSNSPTSPDQTTFDDLDESGRVNRQPK